MRAKTYKKSSAWWKHGKHKGQVEAMVRTNQEIERGQKRREALKETAPSIKELFKKEKT